jgi:menaquinone-specific isochorismate synthase
MVISAGTSIPDLDAFRGGRRLPCRADVGSRRIDRLLGDEFGLRSRLGEVSAVAAVPLAARSYPIADEGGLLDRIASDAPFAWVRDGEGLVGWGEAARIDLHGPDRFAAAEMWWAQVRAGLSIDDAVGVAGSGPVAFASFAFDPDGAQSVLVMPKVVFGARSGQCWVTLIGGAEELTAPAADWPAVTAVSFADGALTPRQWVSSVANAVRRIQAGELEKVVLARDLIATAAAPIDQGRLLRQLAVRYPSCWSFAVDGLVGSTPELLVGRLGGAVTSRVLAGTVKRFGDEVVDAEQAQALMRSEKDRLEHRFAVRSVQAVLAEHCSELDVPAEPQVLSLANVQHLATELTGRLVDAATVLTLAAAIHPTAAVCGTPTATALTVIRELEGMDRDRYAGPVGWLGSDGDGEFGIALRCALIQGRQARLFAGCGIVAQSDPEAELAESDAKLVAMRDALEVN